MLESLGLTHLQRSVNYLAGGEIERTRSAISQAGFAKGVANVCAEVEAHLGPTNDADELKRHVAIYEALAKWPNARTQKALKDMKSAAEKLKLARKRVLDLELDLYRARAQAKLTKTAIGTVKTRKEGISGK
jgi:hypothetical protein